MSISNYIASAYSSIGTARANITRAVVLSDGTVVEDPSDVHLHNRARDIKNRLLAEREQLLKDLNTVHPSERARVQAEINRIDEKLENPGASNSQSNTRGINQDELNEAFDDFVVPLPESDEMRTVPAGIVGIIPKLPSQEVTIREAELINSRSYPQQKHLLEIQKDALSVAGEMFPQSSLHNGNGDAFRHAYWNAIMTREFGVDFTRELTNAHEAVPGGGPRNEVFMDLHNNEVGRDIAVQNPGLSNEELAAVILDKLQNGELVVLDNNGLPIPSDPVENIELTDIENGNYDDNDGSEGYAG